MTKRSILDIRRRMQPRTGPIEPKKRASVETSVIYEVLRHAGWDDETYALYIESYKEHLGGSLDVTAKVTLRPGKYGGHWLIIRRCRWLFTKVEEGVAVLGGRGGIKARIPGSAWRELLEKSGCLDEQICEPDWESCYAVSAEDENGIPNTVYFDAALGPGGWYITLVIDCNTGHFTEYLGDRDDGPYESKENALFAAFDGALDWFFTNEYDAEVLDIDKRIKEMGFVYWEKEAP